MRRRELITLLGGAAASWPLAVRAQPAGKLPTIGFLGADASAFSPWTAAFVAHLRELGWIEGSTIAIEYRWSQGRTERYAEIASRVCASQGRCHCHSRKRRPHRSGRRQRVIPIVFAVGIDPVGSGLVASLAQPGGNVTGLSIQANELAGKRLEFARELVPRLHRLAIMFNVGNAQPVLEMGETQAAARMLGSRSRATRDPAARGYRERLSGAQNPSGRTLCCGRSAHGCQPHKHPHVCTGARLPTIFSTRDFVKAGALMSYGPSYTERFRHAADYVNKILRGAKPGDLPVDQPTKFELVINLTTAKALGLRIPPALLARADELLE